jgi:Domain of unknown function (DUF397)
VAHGQDSTEAHFKVSSYSGSGNCVEVDLLRPDDLVGVRHSRRPDEALLLFNRDEWMAFVAGVQNHEFDLD